MTKDKILGGLFGLLVGDAVGTPYEFKDQADIPSEHEIEMTPPEGYERSWSNHPTGIWSDDGSQALCLLEHYMERSQNNDAVWYDDWARKLREWYDGHLWVNNRAFDSGIQTQHAIMNLRAGVHPLNAARYHEQANGNGSLMRTLPIALVHYSLPKELFIEEAKRISLLTHPHPRSWLTCQLYCLIARELLRGAALNDAIWSAEEQLSSYHKIGHLDTDADLNSNYRIMFWDGQAVEPEGTGYVVDAFWSAIYALRSTDSYEGCIKRAISLGNDTDTTACIAGGLAGIIYGYDAIPQRWLDQLKGKDQIKYLVDWLEQREDQP